MATIAYRFQKAVSNSTSDFESFHLGHGTRTTVEITRHIYELLRASVEMLEFGRFKTTHSKILILPLEIERVNAELTKLDRILEEKNPGEDVSKRLLQGPLADILTHIGQISMMSRLNGHAIEGGSYASAPIEIGKLSYF